MVLVVLECELAVTVAPCIGLPVSLSLTVPEMVPLSHSFSIVQESITAPSGLIASANNSIKQITKHIIKNNGI